MIENGCSNPRRTRNHQSGVRSKSMALSSAHSLVYGDRKNPRYSVGGAFHPQWAYHAKRGEYDGEYQDV
jgi:hypothetical protein